ncbi:hypothetical protein [Yinghuangia soli]|uniref:Uncharacterized protein n=1 Tax=Yinghuangia soli TaxID=2908204 RepID=A0AA41U384_9ACTN|nr:hypothetical protein [Yinghuangia soli]MCF2529442.1 hypothetical protein [Yinghuangia soli]
MARDRDSAKTAALRSQGSRSLRVRPAAPGGYFGAVNPRTRTRIVSATLVILLLAVAIGAALS